MSIFACQLGKLGRRFYRKYYRMHSERNVFSDDCFGKLCYSSGDQKNSGTTFAIFRSFVLPCVFRPYCWTDLPAIFCGVCDSWTCGKFQCVLYAENNPCDSKLDNFWCIVSDFSCCVHRSSSCINPSFAIQHDRHSSSRIYNRLHPMDDLYNWCCVKVLVKELDYLCPISVSFNFRCHCFQHIKNISDGSKTSAPDSRPKRSRSSRQCGEHAQCRKSAVTVLYFYALLLIFSLPFCVTTLVETFIGYNRAVKIAYIYVTTAVFINSCLNPLVYCWRIREIRQAVRNLLNIKNWKTHFKLQWTCLVTSVAKFACVNSKSCSSLVVEYNKMYTEIPRLQI